MHASQGLGQLDLGITTVRKELAKKFLINQIKDRLTDEATNVVKRVFQTIR